MGTPGEGRSGLRARAERDVRERCSEAAASTRFANKGTFSVAADECEPLPVFSRRKLQC